MEITQCQHQKGKMSQKFDDSLMHLVDNIKHTNIPTIGIHGEEREKDIVSHLLSDSLSVHELFHKKCSFYCNL